MDGESETFIAHTLRGEGFDAGEDGTGRGTPIIAFSSKDHGADAGETAPTLRAMAHSGSHANAGGQVAIAIQERAICENPDAGPGGVGVRDDGLAYTLEAQTTPQAVAFALRGREGRSARYCEHPRCQWRIEPELRSRSVGGAPSDAARVRAFAGFP